MKYLYVLCVVFLLFQSCATFKEANRNTQGTLTRDNLSVLNGVYSNKPTMHRGRGYVSTLDDVLARTTSIIKVINGYDEKFEGDSVIVELSVISDRVLHAKFIKNDQVIHEEDVRVKLKRDGYLYVREKRFTIAGIPFVFGGWNYQTSRITANNEGALFIESKYSEFFGLLVIIPAYNTATSEHLYDKR